MRNTAILIANTNLAGHGTNHDHDAVQEFFESFYPNREVLSNGEDDIWVEISQKELLSFRKGRSAWARSLSSADSIPSAISTVFSAKSPGMPHMPCPPTTASLLGRWRAT